MTEGPEIDAAHAEALIMARILSGQTIRGELAEWAVNEILARQTKTKRAPHREGEPS